MYIAYTFDTFQQRNDVDIIVVCQKLAIISTIICRQRIHDYIRRLTLRDRNTNTSNLGWQQRLSLLNAVLHINSRHIRVCSLLEIYCYHRHSRVGCGRRHISHVLNSIDTLFQRRNNRVQNCLCIGTRITRHHRYCRGSDVRILLNRQ